MPFEPSQKTHPEGTDVDGPRNGIINPTMGNMFVGLVAKPVLAEESALSFNLKLAIRMPPMFLLV